MEMAWIREHMTLATSEDLGTSLIGVQRLQKRHLVNIVTACIKHSQVQVGIDKHDKNVCDLQFDGHNFNDTITMVFHLIG